VFALENFAAVADAAELLQFGFIRLRSGDERRELLEFLCGAPEILPVGLLC
jgi:hypothetical protein